LALAHTPHAPASLVLSLPDIKNTSVRALLLIDGELLVLPMNYFSKFKAYRANFPTPVNSLSYRFQLLGSESSSSLSETFVVRNSCPIQELDQLTSSAPGSRKKLLIEAIKREQNEDILLNTLAYIQKLSAKGEE